MKVMKKDIKLTEFNCEIEDGECCLEVNFTCELHPESDGIGSYEFWGSTYYDAGNTYLVLDDMRWDDSLFTQAQNETIKQYIDDNWENLEEKISQELYDESDDDYPWE